MSKKSKAVSQQIAEEKFGRLLKQVKNHSKAAAESSGSAGELIAKAVEKDHLHRKAFSMFRQLEKMSPEKLAPCLEAFDYYRDIGKLDDIAASAPSFDVIEGGKSDTLEAAE